MTTTQRTFEQIEAEVAAAMDAMLPHLPREMTDEDAARVLQAKHPKLTDELGKALLTRQLNEMWIEDTRIALGLDVDDEADEDERITIEFDASLSSCRAISSIPAATAKASATASTSPRRTRRCAITGFMRNG